MSDLDQAQADAAAVELIEQQVVGRHNQVTAENLTTTEGDYTLIPAPGRIAVRPEKPAERTKGGIIIPDVSIRDEHSNIGTVVAICPEYEQDGEVYEPLYPIGSIVIFGKYVGSKISVGRDNVILMRETEVIARLVPKGEEIPSVSISPRNADA